MPIPMGQAGQPHGDPFDFNPRGEVNSPLRKCSALLRIYGAYRAAPPAAGAPIAGCYLIVQPLGIISF